MKRKLIKLFLFLILEDVTMLTNCKLSVKYALYGLVPRTWYLACTNLNCPTCHEFHVQVHVYAAL